MAKNRNVLYDAIIWIPDVVKDDRSVPVRPTRESALCLVTVPDTNHITYMTLTELEDRVSREKASLNIGGYYHNGRVIHRMMPDFEAFESYLDECEAWLNRVETVEVPKIEYIVNWPETVKFALRFAGAIQLLVWGTVLMQRIVGS